MKLGHFHREVVFARMRLAFELYEASVEMMRLNLRRRYPDADEAAIERRIREWHRTRPDAELDDVSGPGLRVRKRKCKAYHALAQLPSELHALGAA